jgi:hypothetical protein
MVFHYDNSLKINTQNSLGTGLRFLNPFRIPCQLIREGTASSGSRKPGLKTSTSAGMINNAPTRQVNMLTITKKPKNLSGGNTENGSAQNPSITDNALKLIPLPVVVRVFMTALPGSRPPSLSLLKRHRK